MHSEDIKQNFNKHAYTYDQFAVTQKKIADDLKDNIEAVPGVLEA